ncbi:anti-sigma factor [Bacillus gaemokensis]|uniref:Sigma-M negative effector n=1 Tax=Bacillus gaemokensis TaxID=574375 RepID=A0A073KE93_9BACI|nr:anti-sigma factor [Bacillus gaemokensis]KEK24885.1 sigma-M negative effector [Bacillus gaemokensis]KYG30195.1 sigma-M negative effector [Bacillus gaemokensis]
MSCSEFKKIWEKYENGTLTHGEQEKLENHIETCAICEAYLDELLTKTERVKKKLPPPPNLQVPFRRIKWKHRLQTIGFMLAVCMVLYMIGGVLSSIYFQFNNEQKLKEVRDVPALALQATIPNVQIRGGGTRTDSFFGTHSDVNLVKTVGKNDVRLGTFQINSFFTSIQKKEEWDDKMAYQKRLFFVHPQAEEIGDPSLNSKKTWETLQKIPDGTVADVAISFDRSYTLQELESLLYSIFEAQEMPPTPVWYALDTGLEQTDKAFFLSKFEIFGFPNHLSWGNLEERQFKTKEDEVIEMMHTLSKHEDIVKEVAWYDNKPLDLSKRYKYVNKNGVKVYGIVITGPSKELLKLKNSPHIRSAALGNIEFWNWF